jgi:hypothetical protein
VNEMRPYGGFQVSRKDLDTSEECRQRVNSGWARGVQLPELHRSILTCKLAVLGKIGAYNKSVLRSHMGLYCSVGVVEDIEIFVIP